MNDAPPLTPIRPRPQSNAAAADASAQNSASSPAFRFFDLPRELRDRIYLHALASPFPFWWPSATPPKHNVAASLLRVSRQAYDEAAPVLYAHNKFLFTHPSDCNMFRVVSSPYSIKITAVYLRIREKDMSLWTKYLSSKKQDRSMKADLPNLKMLWIFLRSGSLGATPIMMGQMGGALGNLAALGGGMAAAATGAGAIAGPLGFHHLNPAQFAAHMHTLQQNLGGHINAQLTAFHAQVHHQMHALQNQVHNVLGHGPALPPLPNQNQNQNQNHPAAPAPLTLQNNNNNPPAAAAAAAQHPPVPPPPPPPPLHPHHSPFPHPYPLYASFLRWERELGLDQLCLSLDETRPVNADVKIVCIVKLPKAEVTRLIERFPDELAVDRGDARTRFRKVRGVDVCLEINGFETPTA